MARDGLGFTGRDLASIANVPYATLARFEAGATIRAETLEKLRATLIANGVKFIAQGDRIGATVPCA